MKYRREIDGLRALAVVPVILYHAGVPFFDGGFIGVDVFFVISGYLITTIILDELAQGKFSIFVFYERRARRILPALGAVVLTCFPFAWFLMSPEQFKDFSESVVAVSIFSSNILFWVQSGYFDAAGELKPLLHTWSLAVEEQYYLFFPLMVGILWKYGRKPIFFGIVVLAATSLAVSQWWSWAYPSANFYLAPTRVWELFAGSLSTFVFQKWRPKGNNVLGILGIALILFSVFSFDSYTPFPSIYALVPVVGAVLIIIFGSSITVPGKILSWSPFVGIGLISYSAYLWHQPIFVFARLYSLATPPLWVMLALTVVTIPIAYFSWLYIESPFRKKATIPALESKKAVFTTSAILLGCFMFLGLAGYVGDGLAWRFPNAIRQVYASTEDRNPHSVACRYHASPAGTTNMGTLPDPDCIFPTTAQNIDVAVIGDSHADAMAGEVISALNLRGLSATQITVGGCAPFVGFRRSTQDCDAINKSIYSYLVNSDIPTVVIAARYSVITETTRFNNGVGGVELDAPVNKTYLDPICEESSESCNRKNAYKIIEDGIGQLIAAGKNVVLVYPVPEAGWDVPTTYAKLMKRRSSAVLSYPRTAFDARYGDVNHFLDSLDFDNLKRVRPADILCGRLKANECVQAENGQVFYFDDDHLSTAGASLVAPQIAQAAESFVK